MFEYLLKWINRETRLGKKRERLLKIRAMTRVGSWGMKGKER